MQYSTEWFEARKDKITASNIAGCLGLSRHTSRAAAYFNAVGIPSAPNEACNHGLRHEGAAIEAYKTATGYQVSEAKYVVHADITYIGASPDGLVGNDGLVEVTCPWFALEGETPIPATKVPISAYLQMIFQLECTGRSWCDYVSWTETNGMSIFRVYPDADLFNWLTEKESIIEELYDAIHSKRGGFAKFKAGKSKKMKEKIAVSMAANIDFLS